MVFKHVWIFPTLAALFAYLAFFIGYGVGIANDHLDAWFAFISDGGALPPESCIFGELLNLSAMFVAITVYVRHLQIVTFYDKIHHVHGRWRMGSTIMMWLGFVVAFGVSLVANVQETSIPVLHGIGAFMAFLVGVIYIWSQIAFTFVMRPTMTHTSITVARVVFGVFTTVGVLLHIIVQFGNPFVKRESDGTLPTMPPKVDGIVRVPSDSPYYANHLVSTLSEWFLGISLYLFVLTFAFELQHTSTHAPKVILKPKHRNVNKISSTTNTPITAFPNDELPNTTNDYASKGTAPKRTENEGPRNEYYY
ncbi:DNA damage-regulated autophagy modulator protein 1 [Toxocara canis]|uniref:DNA damage-regulated autophagy modulator protein 1 n=1 Tax=Toxocara canis TaxID=6265 RepID=A0A0B2USQ5_TOXCA|nr:DNA damage-regulated autophagy modulator protein 1 [Toxocara canis]